MLFYATLLLASFIVSYTILWVLRVIAANSNSYSTHRVSKTKEEQIVRNGVKQYARDKKRTATRQRGKTAEPATNSNAGGYTARNPKLSGQAYKPSAQAISTFALKTDE